MTPTKPTKPVAVYCRVSRVNGRDVSAEGGTADEQKKRCIATIEGKGLQVGPVFEDLDVSGGKESRPGWDAMMAAVDRGEVGGVCAMNLSRLGRHARVEQVILDLEAKGVAVILTDGEFDTSSSNGRLILGLLSRVNQYYREMMGEQHDDRERRRALAGKPHGPVPVGYVKDEAGRLTPSCDADAIREAFRMKASGKTNREIAEYLDAAVPQLKPWTDARVSQMLKNPTYLGRVTYGDIVTEGAHEPLVDDATFRVANAKAGGTKQRRSDGPLLGSGLLRCGVCGSAMVLKPGGTNGKQLSWVCSSTTRVKGERHPTAADHLIAPYIFIETERRIIDWMKSEPAATKTTAADPALLEDLALAKADVDALDAQLEAGDIAATVYAKAATVAAARVEDLEAQVAAAEGERVVYTREQQQAVEMLDFLRTYIAESPYLPGYVEQPTVRAIREVFRRYLGSVTIHPGRGDDGKIRPVEDRVTFGEPVE